MFIKVSANRHALTQSSHTDLPRLEHWIRQNAVYVHTLLILLVFAVLSVYFLPALIRMDVYTDDMRQHIAWYYSQKDPELFQNDLLKHYYVDTFSPIGYRALYKAISVYIDPQIFGEFLSFLLTISGIILTYSIAQTVTSGSYLGGIIATVLMLFGKLLNIADFMTSFAGGLQRSFAFPFLLLGVWAVLHKRFWVLSIAILLGALLYPPTYISLIMFSICLLGFWLLKRNLLSKVSIQNLILLSGTAFLSLAILLWTKFTITGTWTTYSLQEALKMPEYYANGIFWSPVFFDNPWQYLRGAIPTSTPILFAITTALFIRRATIFKAEALLLMTSGIINYGIAYLLIFKLYEPSRYSAYPLLAFWVIAGPIAIIEIIRLIEHKFNDGAEWFYTFLFNKAIAYALVTLLIISTVSLTATRIDQGKGGMTGSASPEIYEFLKSLPKDIKIAAHPIDADDIPMRSQRSVLVFNEALYPYHKEFYTEMKARTAAIWSAMYASDYDTILALRKQYGADVLIINQQLYGHNPIQGKPFDEILNRYQTRLGNRRPIVFSLPEQTILFRSGSFFVVDLRSLETISHL